MRVIVVIQEPGCPIAAYSVPDVATDQELERYQQALYNQRREQLIQALTILQPNRPRESFKGDDIPMVGSRVIELRELPNKL